MDKIFWIFAIIATVIKAYLLKRGARTLRSEHPELEDGYEKLFKGYLFFGSLPWIVMGIGIMSGRVDGVFNYFGPSEGNSFALAFQAVIIGTYALAVNWIYFGSGAEFLLKHPGIFNMSFKSTTGVKIVAGISLAGGVLGMYLMWLMLAPGR